MSALQNSSSQLRRQIRVQSRHVIVALVGLDLLLHAVLQPELVYALHILLPGVNVQAVVEEVCWVCSWHSPWGLNNPEQV